MIKNILKFINHMFFPNRCAICDKIINFNELVCKSCNKYIDNNYKIVKSQITAEDIGYLTICYSAFEYDNKIRDSILDFKFKKRRDKFRFFSDVILKLINQNLIIDMDNTIILTIPSSIYKSKYNHLKYIGNDLSNQLKIPYYNNIILKNLNVKKQHTLNLKQRKLNIINAFYISKYCNLNKKNIILIDDIITSGSTLNECVRILKLAGANNIFCFTIAKTYFKN